MFILCFFIIVIGVVTDSYGKVDESETDEDDDDDDEESDDHHEGDNTFEGCYDHAVGDDRDSSDEEAKTTSGGGGGGGSGIRR